MPRETKIDTHAPIVQASSARLILVLSSNYPYIVLDGAAQASLLYYLSTLINPSEINPEEVQKAKENLSIKGTIAMIEAIEALSDDKFPREDKLRVFKQMQFIAHSYPEGNWSEAKTQWSINRFFNPSTKKEEILITPPAQALNLVCKALLDESHYRSRTEDEAATDKDHRIANFYNQLLELQRQVEIGQFEKCSAGLQHDLLYLLERAYLGSDAEPIHLLMDNALFLQESLVSFIDKLLKEHSGLETNTMLLDWMRWKTTASTEVECPLILWLRKQFPSEPLDKVWMTECKAYLIHRCEEFFVNPHKFPLDDYVAQIAESAIPTSENALLALIDEMLKMGDLKINPASSMAHLIALRNQRLTQFKEEVTKERKNVDRYAQQIQELFSILAAVSSLYHYRDLTLLIGQEEFEFNQTLQSFVDFLTSYLTDYRLDKEMTSDEVRSFENLNARYRNKERTFIKQSHDDFVSNFFNIAAENLDAALARLKALKSVNATVHPLELTDEQLIQWQAQSGSLTVDGHGVMDVTPYAANRLLLHGLLQPVVTWSPLYCRYLTLLIDWLADPSVEDDINLRAFKQSYPSRLLHNLRIMVIIQTSTLNEALKRQITDLGPEKIFLLIDSQNLLIDMIRRDGLAVEQRIEILDTISAPLGTLIFNINDLFYSLSINQLTLEQRTQILSSFAEQLGTLFRNANQLWGFFSLPLDKLTAEQRTQIFSTLEGKLGTLIRNGDDLQRLLSLSFDQLTLEQRTLIWSSVGDQLGTLIKNGYEFRQLLALPLDKLTLEQRTQMWSSVVGQLGAFIQDNNELKWLFSLPLENFTLEQRIQIWPFLKLETLIGNSKELSELFALPIEKLTLEQRTQILSSVKLETLILKVGNLRELFTLPLEALTSKQRTEILSSLAKQLSMLIRNGEHLIRLFSLSIDKLTSVQRKQILSVLADQLGTLIRNGEELRELFSLPLDKLNSDQRTQILFSLREQLGTLIRDGSELHHLFSLSLEALTSDQRTQILVSLREQLGTLIRNGSELHDLFSLSFEALTSDQRTQIFSSLAGHLGSLIEDNWDLMSVFDLSPEELSSEQRTQILSSVDGKLGTLIESGYCLHDLFSRSLEELTSEQRTQILSSIEEELGTLIQTEVDLKKLFQLSPLKLNPTQREQILNGIGQERFEILIPGAVERKSLLASLSPPSPEEGYDFKFFGQNKSNVSSKITSNKPKVP